jgi:DNA primase
MNNDVLDLLNKKNIQYTLKGKDALIFCLNPDHDDSHPSCRVDIYTGKYNCFACGFGGKNIFEYFNEYYNPINIKVNALKDKISNLILDINGIELPEGIEYYLGSHRDIPPNLYKKYNVFMHPKYGDDRLCFPITDITGKITNILARKLYDKIPPKYIVYPENRPIPVFPVRKNNYTILVEGIYDVLNLEAKGLDTATACFGTKSITDKNVLDKLSPIIYSGTNTLFILLDNDKAGNISAEYLKKCIENKIDIRVIILNTYIPVGKDPGDLTKEEVDSLKEIIENFIY